MKKAHTVLLASLLALIALYVVWFHSKPVALFVFAGPVCFLALGVALRRRTAGFWSALFALLWFSHGVMVAWTRANERGFALMEVVLSVAVVFAASLPGMQARFAKRPPTRPL